MGSWVEGCGGGLKFDIDFKQFGSSTNFVHTSYQKANGQNFLNSLTFLVLPPTLHYHTTPSSLLFLYLKSLFSAVWRQATTSVFQTWLTYGSLSDKSSILHTLRYSYLSLLYRLQYSYIASTTYHTLQTYWYAWCHSSSQGQSIIAVI